MGYAFNYTDHRATPIRTGGVDAKLVRCPNQQFSFIKPKFRTFMLCVYNGRIALLYFDNVFFAEAISIGDEIAR